MSSTSVEELLNHWARKFHTYFLAALYIIFAVNCLIALMEREISKARYVTALVLFSFSKAFNLQHTSPGFTRINKGFNRVAAPSKYLGVTRFHSYLHGNPYYVQFAGTVRRQGALALYLRSGPLYMGRTNLL